VQKKLRSFLRGILQGGAVIIMIGVIVLMAKLIGYGVMLPVVFLIFCGLTQIFIDDDRID